MIKRKNIGVIGGGISSLSLLLNMAKKINFQEDVLKVRLFERKSQVGGRIEAEESPEDSEHHRFCADVGANYIDYENEEEKKFLDANLPKNLLQNFKPFSGKFMIFEDSKLKSSEQQKTRYFYQGGFNHMAEDWRKQIQSEKTMNFALVTDNEVESVQFSKGKWKIRMAGQKKQCSEETFDVLIFGTPASATMSILQRSSLDKGKSLRQELSKIRYTQQLSAIFELQQGQMKSNDSPYSILLKNHELTFICFNQQKYPSNSSNIAVIQTNEEFTQKWAKKLSPGEKEVFVNHNQIQQQIAEEIWKLVPEEIKEKFRLTKKCLGVHYWPQSLIKPLSDVHSKNELFERYNRELNKDFTDENGLRNLYFTGDFLNNKSRVTGAMAVGIKLSQEIMKQHFDIDVKGTL